MRPPTGSRSPITAGPCLTPPGALDVQVGQDPVQPAGQPPGRPAQQRQHGGHQRHADHEGVDQDADRQPKAIVLTMTSSMATKLAKTENMISAAAITTRAACRAP